MGDNKYNQFLIYFLVFFLSATIYYWFPKRVEKAAITKVGTLIRKKITINSIGYYRILRML